MHPELTKTEASLARLARRVADLGLESLTLEDRAALLVYVGHAVIAKGGFRQFYLTEFSLSALVSALRALKLSALADIALSTAAHFSEPGLSDLPVARRSQLDGLQTDRQDYAFFRLSSEELLAAIARYWKRTKPAASSTTR